MENQTSGNSPKENREVGNFKELKKQNEWHDHADTDKYLAMEQPGVSYTGDSGAPRLSDAQEGSSEVFDPAGKNSRNADAFAQDDYILKDNIDLDEDQNQSVSSEENDK